MAEKDDLSWLDKQMGEDFKVELGEEQDQSDEIQNRPPEVHKQEMVYGPGWRKATLVEKRFFGGFLHEWKKAHEVEEIVEIYESYKSLLFKIKIWEFICREKKFYTEAYLPNGQKITGYSLDIIATTYGIQGLVFCRHQNTNLEEYNNLITEAIEGINKHMGSLGDLKIPPRYILGV